MMKIYTQSRVLQSLIVLCLLVCLSSSLSAQEYNLVIGNEKQQKMRYGMDFERLWYWSNNLNAEERALVAKWSVVDTGIDYIRVAINSSYELKEGELNPKAYTKKIIPMMKVMQQANPNIKFFASPRPHNEEERKAQWQPYAQWITGDIENKGRFDFKWEKCAEHLVRYFELMKKNGFKISFLDVTNEWQSTSERGGRVTAEDVQKINSYLRKKLPTDEMPQIVAPSSWNYRQGTQWLTTLNTDAKRKGVNIASSHNTDRTGTAAEFAKMARRVLGKDVEVWNTEQHGWKSTSKQNEVTSFSYMLESINAGFSGVSGWLAIGTSKQGHSYILNPKGTPKRNVKYFIFKKLSTTSNYGHALEIIDAPTKQLSHTSALIKGNLLTVWAINKGETEVPLKITPKGRKLVQQAVTRTHWVDPKDVEGHVMKQRVTDTSSLSSVIPPQSVCCFEVLLQP